MLVEPTQLLEKYARQIGSSPRVGVKNKKHLKPPPRQPHDFRLLSEAKAAEF